MILIGKLRGNLDSYDDRSDEGFDERRYNDRRNKVKKKQDYQIKFPKTLIKSIIITFPQGCLFTT